MILQLITWILGAVAFVYVLLVLMTFFFQRNMMYFPSGNMPLSKSAIEGIGEIAIETKDNLKLTAWYKPAQQGRKTILSFHGNASNMEWESKKLRPFANEGYGILIASYRGYNGNQGTPTETGLYKDANAHIDWLNSQGIKDGDIILYGESLGSGVAVEMAATEGRVFYYLMLESPYTSTVDVAKKAYPYLPVSLLMRDRYDSVSKIKNVKTPIIIAHGTNDAIVPYIQGQKLFEQANEPKTFVSIPKGAHANLSDFGVSDKYLSILNNQNKGD